MQKGTKQFIIESVLIVGFAIVVAIAYNTLNPNGLNLLRKPTVVNDTLLRRLLSEPSFNRNYSETVQTVEPKEPIRIDTAKPHIGSEKIAKAQTNEDAEPTFTKETNVELVEIKYSQLIKYLNHPNLILIDARRPEDFEAGHIANAINIFAYEENMDKYFKALGSIPIDKSKVIIVYCDGGTCDASHKVAKDLIRLGHKNVFVYTGGWEEWSYIQKKHK